MAEGAAGARAARLTYGELLRLTEGHGTSEVYERVRVIVAALRQFGQHTETCATVRQEWSGRSQHMENVDGPCDCGLDAALSVAPAPAEVPPPSDDLGAPAAGARAAEGWQETAAQYARNSDYYRALVVEIGAMFGDAAYIADDGSRAEDVLCAKVPELVRALLVAPAPAEVPPPDDSSGSATATVRPCPHEEWQRDYAAVENGMCPICQAARLEELRGVAEFWRKAARAAQAAYRSSVAPASAEPGGAPHEH